MSNHCLQSCCSGASCQIKTLADTPDMLKSSSTSSSFSCLGFVIQSSKNHLFLLSGQVEWDILSWLNTFPVFIYHFSNALDDICTGRSMIAIKDILLERSKVVPDMPFFCHPNLPIFYHRASLFLIPSPVTLWLTGYLLPVVSALHRISVVHWILFPDHQHKHCLGTC